MKKVLACLLTIFLSCTLTACMAVNKDDLDKKTLEDSNNEVVSGISLNIGDYILFGKYDDKPILWRCVDIDENGILMLSDKSLCSKPFDTPSMMNGSHVRRVERDGGIGGSNYWGDSNIRSWLNSAAPAGGVDWLCGNPPNKENKQDIPDWYWNDSYNNYNNYDEEKGFLADGNFTETERNAIKEVSQKSLLDQVDVDLAVGGSKEAWGFADSYINIKSFIENQYDEICFECLTDKVFLLDIKQLWNINLNSEILGDKYIGEGYCLRTPFGRDWQYSVSDTVYSGYRVLTATTYDDINSWSVDAGFNDACRNYDIRPAFYLNESTAVILSGSGAKVDPYIIDGVDDTYTASRLNLSLLVKQ